MHLPRYVVAPPWRAAPVQPSGLQQRYRLFQLSPSLFGVCEGGDGHTPLLDDPYHIF